MVVILWEIENLEPGILCAWELNCGFPEFEKLQSLVDPVLGKIVDRVLEVDLSNT